MDNTRKPARQEWKPNLFLSIAQKVWMVAFGLVKIAIGAAATVAIICGVCALVFANVLGDYLENDIIPNANYDLESVTLDLDSTIYYVDRNDGEIKVLQEIYAANSRRWATYEEIPEDLIHAVVAIEDKRFFEHQGVDWVTTVKACARMFLGGGSAGGSSITQQLIKNMTHEDSVTVQRKVLEIFRATRFEQRYDKELILEYYLNCIFLGEGCYGVKTAAAAYFGKELETLSTAECAALISITNNPSMYDPYIDPEANQERQRIVLGEMLNQGWITREQYTQAIAQPIVLKRGIDPEDRMVTCPNEDCGYHGLVRTLLAVEDGKYVCPECRNFIDVDTNSSQNVYSWFVDTVLEDVAKDLAAQNGVEWTDEARDLYIQMIQRGGYHILATIDMNVQNKIDQIYTDLSQIPSVRSGQQLQSAIVVKDNRTGDIVGMCGGVGPDKGFDDFNRATDSRLQTGSSIKPLSAYAPAFELEGFSPATVVKDLPLWYDNGPYPLNDTRTYSYSRTIYDAIIHSVNAVSANTVDTIGLSYSYNFAKNQFGLSGLVEQYGSGADAKTDIAVGPLALGAQTLGVSVRDMTDAFSTFPNGGVYRKGRTYTKVYDRDGNLVLDNTQETREILSAKTANYINICLRAAANSGTGSEASLSNIATYGKTGTTGNNKDRWFCGYTGYYTAAVWCGFDQPEVISVTSWGINNPSSYLWRKVMTLLHEGKTSIQLEDRNAVRWASMCLMSGKIATDACKLDIRESSGLIQSAPYCEGDLKNEVCDKHVLVDYCVTGGGVATDYCKLFAAEDLAVIEQKALVKMTKEEIEEIQKAASYRLDPLFTRDDYVYLINEDGSDGVFKGFNGDANRGVDAPYVVCTIHTKEAWERYQASQQPEPVVPNWPWFGR